MKLFFVSCESSDFNLDLFVQAENPETAFAMAREYWIHEWDQDENLFIVKIIPGPPPGKFTEEAARIFEIEPNGHTTGVFDWGNYSGAAGSCKLIGHVVP